jgi:RNA polymerase sigma factor (sigma-70 family)
MKHQRPISDSSTTVGVTAMIRPGSVEYERLLRTTYLLTGGSGAAEEVLGQALARVAAARSRHDTSQAGTLAMLVRVYLSPWRRARGGEPDGGEPQAVSPGQAEPREREPQEREPQEREPQEREPQEREPQEREPQEREPQEREPGPDGGRDRIRSLLAKLPKRTRAVLVLRYYEGLAKEQVVEALDCPVALVKREETRGLARLRASGVPRPPGATAEEAGDLSPEWQALWLAEELTELAGEARPRADGMERFALRLRSERRIWLFHRGAQIAFWVLAVALVVRVATWVCFGCCCS